jgi:hypothetical protein
VDFRDAAAPELFAFLASAFFGDFMVDDVPESPGAIGKEGAVLEFGILRQLICAMGFVQQPSCSDRNHSVVSQFMFSYGLSPPSSHSRRK